MLCRIYWLIKGLDLGLRLERQSKVVFKLPTPAQQFVHMASEYCKGIPTRSLCVIESYVGLTGEFRRIRGAGGKRSADTGTNDDVGAIDLERISQTLYDPCASRVDHLTVGFFEQDGEFITPDAADERRRHDLIHAMGHE